MIRAVTAAEMVDTAAAHWAAELAAGRFTDQLAGKEPGHALAPLVEVATRELLAERFAVHEATGADGVAVVRDIADLWLTDAGVAHPVNVKFGVRRADGEGGRPNMVSLVRLLSAVAESRVDSYYVLRVSFAADGSGAQVRLGNILEHLDRLAFDAGTGQMMAKPALWEAISGLPAEELDLGVALGQLLALYEDGVERLFANRQATLAKLRTKVDAASHLGVRLDQRRVADRSSERGCQLSLL